MLRGHQRILFAYLSLGPRINPQNVNDMETLQIACPTFYEGRTRGPVIVGFNRRGHNSTLNDQVGRVVAVQQVHRNHPGRPCSRGYTRFRDSPATPKSQGCTGKARISKGTHFLPG